MLKVFICVAGLVLTSSPSFASSLTIKFINQSGQAISSITATAKGKDQPINLPVASLPAIAKLAASQAAGAFQASDPVMPPVLQPPTAAQTSLKAVIATRVPVKALLAPPIMPTPVPVVRNVDPSEVKFIVPDKTCVFNLTITLASGKITTLPDTDLCQTEQIIVQ
jgi:hypothetical protein